ncbi:MAG TPA: 5-dehydro-4-deoxy-D-glucuronate isomerase [Acidobacteriaceae bacterium]|jgi:4-deoxy-L-threo-5-hexosulose-uronate ketol-isomerase|nr:5-dehydro-4-deoxy-D-glucuronate isomerase [Acidobacteriaceae bacterium]
MKILQLADAVRYPSMTTEELRATFLLAEFFQPGQIDLTYVDLDRTIIGSAVPLEEKLTLPADDLLRAEYFTERRELGVLNIGDAGTVTVNEQRFELASLDALYIGRGNEQISFESADPKMPAEFYLLSYPAHSVYPTTLIRGNEQERTRLGAQSTANDREIVKLIHLEGARSCQLVMGFTQLAPGNVWNTMPAHTHMRRSEVYLYFDLPGEERILHLMGPAHETRHIVVANKQVVISPGWSIHAGVGTASYTFCWGMGGENQVYTDMDKLATADLL